MDRTKEVMDWKGENAASIAAREIHEQIFKEFSGKVEPPSGQKCHASSDTGHGVDPMNMTALVAGDELPLASPSENKKLNQTDNFLKIVETSFCLNWRDAQAAALSADSRLDENNQLRNETIKGKVEKEKSETTEANEVTRNLEYQLGKTKLMLADCERRTSELKDRICELEKTLAARRDQLDKPQKSVHRAGKNRSKLVTSESKDADKPHNNLPTGSCTSQTPQQKRKRAALPEINQKSILGADKNRSKEVNSKSKDVHRAPNNIPASHNSLKPPQKPKIAYSPGRNHQRIHRTDQSESKLVVPEAKDVNKIPNGVHPGSGTSLKPQQEQKRPSPPARDHGQVHGTQKKQSKPVTLSSKAFNRAPNNSITGSHKCLQPPQKRKRTPKSKHVDGTPNNVSAASKNAPKQKKKSTQPDRNYQNQRLAALQQYQKQNGFAVAPRMMPQFPASSFPTNYTSWPIPFPPPQSMPFQNPAMLNMPHPWVPPRPAVRADWTNNGFRPFNASLYGGSAYSNML